MRASGEHEEPAPAPKGWLLRRPRRLVAGAAVAVGLAALYPWAVGSLAARVASGKLTERLGRNVTIGRGRAGLGGVTFERVAVGSAHGEPSPVSIADVHVPFGALLGGTGPVLVEGLALDLRRGGDADNVSDIITRLGHKSDSSTDSAGARRHLPAVELSHATLTLDDATTGVTMSVPRFDATIRPGEKASITVTTAKGKLRLGGGTRGPTFGAASVVAEIALEGLRPSSLPNIVVKGGFASPLPTLDLTGIEGKVAPGASADRVTLAFTGSWGGAKETLWTARGWVAPATREGELTLKAERFSLDRIADILHGKVIDPAAASVDAHLDVAVAAGKVTFKGDLGVAGLSIKHDALASTPVENLALELELRGTGDIARRRVDLERLEGRLRDLVGRVSGSFEMGPEDHVFPDGSKMHGTPKLDVRVQVPRLPCAKLLASIPAALLPKLKGFELAGAFEADISTKVDFADLENADLRGTVGIDGCRVITAPPGVASVLANEPISHTVDVPKTAEVLLAPVRGNAIAPGAPGGPLATEPMTFVLGAENPDFVPFEEISPYLINSIMTTEDSGFFKHRGYVTSEFKTALRRNLAKGGFRLGASSITMQMVKNLLLSQEKTLSRKLQELFLVWYLEQELPKERILELYFNAIEFGPRLYGIGPATRHYFGKRPSELTPLEASFFSSILPNPKRRYVQYCHGALSPSWDKYVRRILARVHERGRITDAEYASSSAEALVFDRAEASMTERQCLEWVKKITEKPEPDAPPEPDEK